MAKTDLQRGGRIEDLLVSYFPSPAHSPASSVASSSRVPAMSPLDLGDGPPPGMVRRPSRSSIGEGGRSGSALSMSAAAASSSLDLGVSPGMPEDTDELFARDQALLREEDEEEQRKRGVNSWATSLSTPHEVLVTTSPHASSSSSALPSSSSSKSTPAPPRPPFNVPPSSLRGHESAFNRGSLPKPDYVAEGATRLRCRMCRREIAARDHVVEHDVGVGKGAFDVKKRGKDRRNEKRSVAVEQRGAGGGGVGLMEDGEALQALKLEDGGEGQQEQPQQQAGGEATSVDDDGQRRPILQSAASLTASLPPHLAALRAGRAPPGARIAQAEALRQSQARSSGAVEQVKTNGVAGAAQDSATPSASSASSSHAPTRRPTLPPLLPSPSCTSYFLEPLSWMSLPTDGSHQSLSGKLLCPNQACRSKLGSWDWAGVQCACGAWVTPGFAVLRSRVDEVEGGRGGKGGQGEVKRDR